jgi:hypothetical protein
MANVAQAAAAQEIDMEKTDKSSRRDKPSSSPDKLVETTRKTDVELTEEDLGKISGGPTAVEYKI